MNARHAGRHLPPHTESAMRDEVREAERARLQRAVDEAFERLERADTEYRIAIATTDDAKNTRLMKWRVFFCAWSEAVANLERLEVSA